DTDGAVVTHQEEEEQDDAGDVAADDNGLPGGLLFASGSCLSTKKHGVLQSQIDRCPSDHTVDLVDYDTTADGGVELRIELTRRSAVANRPRPLLRQDFDSRTHSRGSSKAHGHSGPSRAVAEAHRLRRRIGGVFVARSLSGPTPQQHHMHQAAIEHQQSRSSRPAADKIRRHGNASLVRRSREPVRPNLSNLTFASSAGVPHSRKVSVRSNLSSIDNDGSSNLGADDRVNRRPGDPEGTDSERRRRVRRDASPDIASDSLDSNLSDYFMGRQTLSPPGAYTANLPGQLAEFATSLPDQIGLNIRIEVCHLRNLHFCLSTKPPKCLGFHQKQLSDCSRPDAASFELVRSSDKKNPC
ncbi:unnamed protein product, partial [Protopolystoma xenopodis]